MAAGLVSSGSWSQKFHSPFFVTEVLLSHTEMFALDSFRIVEERRTNEIEVMNYDILDT